MSAVLARRHGACPACTTDTMGIPAFVRNPDGSTGITRRHCTREFKLRPIRRKVRELIGERPRPGSVDQLIGISADEATRIKPSGVRYITNRYPLVDMLWRRGDCTRYVESFGIGSPPRSACVYCPYHSDAEWRRLRENADDWERAVKVDVRLRSVNRHWQGEHERTGKKMGAHEGDLFLHRSCVPLAEAPIDLDTTGTLWDGLWDEECEGLCGL